MMRVALVHDWLVGQRGGENVLLEMARMFPDAPIFTLVHIPGRVDPEIDSHPIHTSFIQQLPGAPRAFRRYLPLFPRAVERWDLSEFDLILSTSHCVAKGVRTQPGQRHISYIHTPMRYLWDQLPEYIPKIPGRRWLTRLARLATLPLRRWDVASAERPTQLLANSRYVARRIERYWSRTAQVLHPPVNVQYFAEAPELPRSSYLVVSALVPYKRVDLAVRVATESSLPLEVVGDGPEAGSLRAMAGPTVTFAGSLGIEALREAYARARALLFCGVEDFGIVPVEAMAAGCPVIALREGGAMETVVGEGKAATGLFFDQPTVTSLAEAVKRFESLLSRGEFRREVLLEQAARFDRAAFLSALETIIA